MATMGRVSSEKPPIPAWAWVFAAACGVIPVLTLGGALPGAIGFGGAAASVAVARDPEKSPGARFGICLAITALCWGLFLALVGGVTLLSR
jgi:hypothetical protein